MDTVYWTHRLLDTPSIGLTVYWTRRLLDRVWQFILAAIALLCMTNAAFRLPSLLHSLWCIHFDAFALIYFFLMLLFWNIRMPFAWKSAISRCQKCFQKRPPRFWSFLVSPCLYFLIVLAHCVEILVRKKTLRTGSYTVRLAGCWFYGRLLTKRLSNRQSRY